MISDVLSDAVVSIQEYLDHPGTRECYVGDVRKRIMKLMAAMTELRIELDAPPWVADEESP
jgi:arginyl-tRNA synthetase